MTLSCSLNLDLHSDSEMVHYVKIGLYMKLVYVKDAHAGGG